MGLDLAAVVDALTYGVVIEPVYGEGCCAPPPHPQTFAMEGWLCTRQVSPEAASRVAQAIEAAFAAFDRCED